MIDQHRDGMNAIVINLARRSQVLVEQQIRLLSTMEREERDPLRLAGLSRLGHFAARLRRNDENILVLAGGQVRRRGSESTVLDGLILAASEEIEDYQRVQFNIGHFPVVAGHAVNDLVHLFAELLENAVVFSPPEKPVRVVSRMDDGEVSVDVTDEGIGLSPSGLADANDMLSQPPDLDTASSERMGLVVVSHLAARHQVHVGLRSSQAGTCATVKLPRELFVEERAR